MKRLHVLWRIQGGLSLVDLGNEFFLEKFSNAEDRDFALFEGPWMVADHYLTVRRWHPNFDPEEATIERRWRSVLWKIGNHIGRTLKIDRTTSKGTRGNYARYAWRKKVVPLYPTRQHIRVEIRRRKLMMGVEGEVAKKAGRKISKRSDSREISRPRNLRRVPQKARSESDLM
ncbi:hypothetical protein NC651_019240 [Populus alba x Populus x berolinensis]|nr:hypothetical protein NC651_019240 [Populus alba x Populus x berolinensis]